MDELKDETGKIPYSEPKLIYYGGLAELVQNGHSIGKDNTNDDNASTGS
jgi:hypothetical protein